MDGAYSSSGRDEEYKSLVGKLDGMKPVAKPILTWKDNIRLNLKWDDRLCTGLIGSVQWQILLNMVMNLRAA